MIFNNIYQNKLDKTCFQHDVAYGDFKHLPGRTASDKVHVIKHLIMLKIQNMMDIKEVLFQWIKMFFEKKSSGGVVTRADKSAIKSEIMTIQQLAKDIQIINY